MTGLFGRVVCAVVLFVVLSVQAFAIDTKERQRAAVLAMISELETHYGMAKFKEEQLGVRISEVRDRYLRLVDQARTLEEDAGLQPPVQRPILPPEEFRQLLVGLGAEFQDGHLNILRQTSNLWTLGIKASEIDGRLFIVGFHPEYFQHGNTKPNLAVGDEIIAVDGKPVSQIASELVLYSSLATHASRYSDALEWTVNWGHRRLRPKTEGTPVELTFVRHPQTASAAPLEFKGRFHWINTRDYRRIQTYMNARGQEIPQETSAPKDSAYTYGDGSTKTTYFSQGLGRLGLPRGAVINLAQLLNTQIRAARNAAAEGEPHDRELAQIKPVDRLDVYTVRHAGKTLGVVRMPSYSPATFGDMINEIRWLTAAVEMLEQQTDGVIIDQLSNGGGYIFGVSQFVRLFADNTLKGVTIDMRLSDTLINGQEMALEQRKKKSPSGEDDNEESDDGIPDEIYNTDANFSELYLNEIHIKRLRERQAQSGWSGPLPYMGSADNFSDGEHGRIVGRANRSYTKPVLILNDSRSASGGDFMPAIMQANGRAKVFGETSMGLGGPVYRSIDSMPGSEMFIRCTYGFCERSDGLPIENLGVVPDIQRWVTRHDLASGFRHYAKDALDAAAALIDGEEVSDIQTEIEARYRRPMPNNKPFRHVLRLVKALNEDLVSAAQTPAGITNVYVDFFKKMSIASTEKLSRDDWALIRLPLPKLLLEQDVFLASLRRHDEVLDRLTRMRRVPRFQAQPELIQLIDTLIEGISGLGEVRFNICQEALRKR